MGKGRPVVRAPVHRNLIKLASTGLHDIGNVVGHQRAVVLEAILYKKIDDRLGYVVDWCTVAARRTASGLPMRLQSTFKPVSLFRL